MTMRDDARHRRETEGDHPEREHGLSRMRENARATRETETDSEREQRLATMRQHD